MTTGMRIIKPIVVTDAILTFSNVAETDYPEYASGTTYALGAMVIITTGVHKVYKSAKASNLAHYPPDNIYDDSVDPATGWWIEVGATNKWKMFEGKSRSPTSNADLIEVELTPGVLFNSLALLGLVAKTVTVTVTDPVDGEVYAESIDLYDPFSVYAYYDWAFSEIVRRPTVVRLELPAYPNATIKISVDNSGETAEVGECIIGPQKSIGTLLYGYSVSLDDYSTKTFDEDGNAEVEERTYAEPISYRMRVDSPKVYDIKRTLGQYRATPLVFIGAESELESIVYGWIAAYSFTRDNANHSTLTLDVEELS